MWTAERNERLFMLIIKDVKLNYEKLQKEWKERYGMHHLLTQPDASPQPKDCLTAIVVANRMLTISRWRG